MSDATQLPAARFGWLRWAFGLGLLALLLSTQDLSTIWLTLGELGFWLAATVVIFAAFLLVASFAWRPLLPDGLQLSWFRLWEWRWLANSINNLLPVAQVGGDVWRCRLAMQAGTRPAPAIASVIADVTLGTLGQAIFSLCGAVLLMTLPGQGNIAMLLLVVMLAFSLALAIFVYLQYSGKLGKSLKRMIRKFRQSGDTAESVTASAVEVELKSIYDRPGAVAKSIGWRLAALVVSVGEVWLLLWVFGVPQSFAMALLLESLTLGLRRAAFIIPGGFGIQEGGFMLLGASLGLSQEVGLSISLAKRAREFLVGLPAIAMLGHLGKSPSKELTTANS